MCMWRDEHEVKVEGVGRWNAQYSGVEVGDGGREKTFYSLLTQSSSSMKNAWDISQNTIICMAQRIEAMRASLLDTSTQDAPAAQYSWTQHSFVQEEESQASRGIEKKDTHTFEQTQREGMRGCVPNNLCHCHLRHHHDRHIHVERRPHRFHTHSAAENCDCEHPLALWFTCRAHHFHRSQ